MIALLVPLLLSAPALAEPPSLEGAEIEVPVEDDDGFVAFFSTFQAAVARKDAEAVAGVTQFPFSSWDLLGKLPKALRDTFEGGPAQLDRAQFLKVFPKLFDGEARASVARGRWTKREEFDVPAYSLGIWSVKDCVIWVDFARGDDGVWRLIRTDDVCGG